MFKRTVSYKAFYVGKFPSFEEDIKPALACAAEQSGSLECGITVIAPSKDRFNEGLLSRLPSAIGRETPKTLKANSSKAEPVVLACWPSANDLDQLDGLAGLQALIVVPWDEGETEVWRTARTATDLLGARSTTPTPSIGDPIVAQAMRSLTTSVNLSTGLHHPSDRSAAIQALRILTRNGRHLDPEEIQIWAMANGWAAEDARELGEYTQGVISGKGYRVGPEHWRSDIMTIWEQQATAET